MFVRFTTIISLFVLYCQFFCSLSQYLCYLLLISPYKKNINCASCIKYEYCNSSRDLLLLLTFLSCFVNFFVAFLNLFITFFNLFVTFLNLFVALLNCLVAFYQTLLTRKKYIGLSTLDISIAILCSKYLLLVCADCYIFVFHHVLYTTVSRFFLETFCHSLSQFCQIFLLSL